MTNFGGGPGRDGLEVMTSSPPEAHPSGMALGPCRVGPEPAGSLPTPGI